MAPQHWHCVKSVQIWNFFWSVFSRICTEYGDFFRNSPYSVRIRENTDQKKTPYLDTFHTVWWYCVVHWNNGNLEISKHCVVVIDAKDNVEKIRISIKFLIRICTIEKVQYIQRAASVSCSKHTKLTLPIYLNILLNFLLMLVDLCDFMFNRLNILKGLRISLKPFNMKLCRLHGLIDNVVSLLKHLLLHRACLDCKV